MTFMVLMKYTVLGFFGSGLLILLAKGIMAHLMQRREDYYEGCRDSSEGGCLGAGSDDTCAGFSNEHGTGCNDNRSVGFSNEHSTDCNDDSCAGFSNERRTDCNDDSSTDCSNEHSTGCDDNRSTDCNNGCDGMGTQGGGADV